MCRILKHLPDTPPLTDDEADDEAAVARSARFGRLPERTEPADRIESTAISPPATSPRQPAIQTMNGSSATRARVRRWRCRAR